MKRTPSCPSALCHARRVPGDPALVEAAQQPDRVEGVHRGGARLSAARACRRDPAVHRRDDGDAAEPPDAAGEVRDRTLHILEACRPRAAGSGSRSRRLRVQDHDKPHGAAARLDGAPTLLETAWQLDSLSASNCSLAALELVNELQLQSFAAHKLFLFTSIQATEL